MLIMGQGGYEIEVDRHLPDNIYTRLCYICTSSSRERLKGACP